MASNVEYKTILIGAVIGLLIGAGAGYFFGQSPIAGYKDEVDRLERENLELQSQQAQLKEERKDLQDQLDNITGALYSTQSSLKKLQKELEESLENYDALQLSYEELEEDYTELNLTYTGLLNTLGIQALKNYSQEIPFDLVTGYRGNAHKTCTFDAGYGILIDVDIDYTSKGEYGSRVEIAISWRRGDSRGFLGSSSYSPSENPQHLSDTAFCEIYNENNGYLWIRAGARPTELSWTKREAHGMFHKTP